MVITSQNFDRHKIMNLRISTKHKQDKLGEKKETMPRHIIIKC